MCKNQHNTYFTYCHRHIFPMSLGWFCHKYITTWCIVLALCHNIFQWINWWMRVFGWLEGETLYLFLICNTVYWSLRTVHYFLSTFDSKSSPFRASKRKALYLNIDNGIYVLYVYINVYWIILVQFTDFKKLCYCKRMNNINAAFFNDIVFNVKFWHVIFNFRFIIVQYLLLLIL